MVAPKKCLPNNNFAIDNSMVAFEFGIPFGMAAVFLLLGNYVASYIIILLPGQQMYMNPQIALLLYCQNNFRHYKVVTLDLKIKLSNLQWLSISYFDAYMNKSFSPFFMIRYLRRQSQNHPSLNIHFSNTIRDIEHNNYYPS
jgi:hypothetical protein